MHLRELLSEHPDFCNRKRMVLTRAREAPIPGRMGMLWHMPKAIRYPQRFRGHMQEEDAGAFAQHQLASIVNFCKQTSDRPMAGCPFCYETENSPRKAANVTSQNIWRSFHVSLYQISKSRMMKIASLRTKTDER